MGVNFGLALVFFLLRKQDFSTTMVPKRPKVRARGKGWGELTYVFKILQNLKYEGDTQN